MSELTVKRSGPLRATMRVPGDKSISHRAVMLAAVARGKTRIEGLLASEDVMATAGAFASLGVRIERDHDTMIVPGRGPDALKTARHALDLGNSGTSMRLLTGLLAGLPVEALLIGDKSLMKRPMKRVIEPLRMMGADVGVSPAGTAPIMIRGADLTAIDYQLPVASAQVKSAILLAGLSAQGVTRVTEPGPTRDHTELMLPSFGVEVGHDGPVASIEGGQELVSPGLIQVPGDISSAAFFLVAALIVPDSDLTIEGLGVNPTRTGVIDVLKMMGARVAVNNPRLLGREPVADVRVRAGELKAVEIAGELVVRAIDELPVLAIAAARAEGRTVIRDAAELRVKESDRIAAVERLLTSLGVRVESRPDGLIIEGPADLRGARVDCGLDHRIGMSAAVAGLVASGETVVEGSESIASSFPDFEARLTDAVR